MRRTEEVWEAFSFPLKQYIQKKVSKPHDAEDILQEVFIRIYSSIHNLRDESKIRGWVYQITRNSIYDYYRNKKNVTELSEAIAQDKANGAEQFMMRELNRSIYEMLDHLPEKYREALFMTEMDGMTQKEMSMKLGISLSAAKSRVQRAREYMKQMILNCCEVEFDRQGYVVDYQIKEEGCENNLACCK